eukprot:SM000005S17312  [mRNA]  locus=s5:1356241:1366812:- [translate_table: standard]
MPAQALRRAGLHATQLAAARAARAPGHCARNARLPSLPAASGTRSVARTVMQPVYRASSASTSMAEGLTKDAVVSGLPVQVTGAPGISEAEIEKALASVPFKDWEKALRGPGGILNLGCTLRRITIQSVDMFGQRVGFVKFKADIYDNETKSKLPGIVFARGGAVGILMLLECEGEQYAVLTEQARVPVGRAILELPAGMLDDGEGDFVGTAAREVEEETGIHLKAEDLVDLTALLDPDTSQKMYPSPGGSDEQITLFLYRTKVDKEIVEQLRGRKTGLRDHGELIQVRLVPYPQLWRSSADSKVLAACAIYEMASREGLLPPPPKSESELSGHRRPLLQLFEYRCTVAPTRILLDDNLWFSPSAERQMRERQKASLGPIAEGREDGGARPLDAGQEEGRWVGGGDSGGALWLAEAPSKRWTELFFLAYSPVWIAWALGVIVPLKLFEVCAAGCRLAGVLASYRILEYNAHIYNQGHKRFTEWEYMCVGLAACLPCFIIPLLIVGKGHLYRVICCSPLQADRGRPWHERHWVKANVWIAIFSFVGNYLWTHYFYTLLGASYTFPSWRLNGVPIPLYLLTHAYFCFYHTVSTVTLRRLQRALALWPRLWAWTARAAWVFALSYFMAFMETFTIANFQYYTFIDKGAMYRVGSLFYAIYFFVSFPMYFQMDENVAQPWSISQAAINSLGATMLVTLLLDFWRLSIGPIVKLPAESAHLEAQLPWLEKHP